VFILAVVQIFSASRIRDYVFLAAIAFAQLLAAATLTIGTLYLLCFAVFLLFALSTFTSLELRRARLRLLYYCPQAAEPPVASIRDQKKMGRLSFALSSTSLIICFGVVILSVLLFFVIPRANRGYLSSLSRPNQRMTGFTDEVELGQLGQIQKSSSAVMHV